MIVMETDLSPPVAPTFAQQRDALQKGLGRAVMWAKAGLLDNNILLEGCLHDQRFDKVCEPLRAEWLWSMIQLTDNTGPFRTPILSALRSLEESTSIRQLCALAYQYASHGDDAFRSQLYEIVKTTPIADSPWLGESEIVALDGDEAILFAAEIRGKRLQCNDEKWDDIKLIYDGVEAHSEGHLVRLLSESADSNVQFFFAAWQNSVAMKLNEDPKISYKDQMQLRSADDVIRASKEPDRPAWLRGWGQYADEFSLNAVEAALWKTSDLSEISRLLQVFARTPLPIFDRRLILLCEHDDFDVCRRAINALEENTHPEIRCYALELLHGELAHLAVGLLIKNFEPGDEIHIIDLLCKSESAPEELHRTCLDAIKVLEKNADTDGTSLALLAYFMTPCQICRGSASKLLEKYETAPSWLIEELRFDAETTYRATSEK